MPCHGTWRRNQDLPPSLGALAQRHGADLLFGAPRYAAGRSYNSVRLITAAGRNGGHYDKHRLVVVAEANPLTPAWSETHGITLANSPRATDQHVLPSFVPLGVSICHELLFPEVAARGAGRGGATGQRIQRRLARPWHRHGQPPTVRDGGLSGGRDASVPHSGGDDGSVGSVRPVWPHRGEPSKRKAGVLREACTGRRRPRPTCASVTRFALGCVVVAARRSSGGTWRHQVAPASRSMVSLEPSPERRRAGADVVSHGSLRPVRRGMAQPFPTTPRARTRSSARCRRDGTRRSGAREPHDDHLGRLDGSAFPGFMVLDNRVVASVGLANWSGATYQRSTRAQVVAMDGRPFNSTAGLYEYIESLPTGSPVRYGLRRNGRTPRSWCGLSISGFATGSFCSDHTC